MGLLDRLFKKDPVKLLDRVEGLLAAGHGYQALQQVREVAAAPEVAERAKELERRCRVTLADKALEEAEFTESEGELGDAAEWVKTAINQLEEAGETGERVAELRERLKRLRARAREAERQREMGGFLGSWGEEDDEDDRPDPLTVEVLFGTLVGTLRDDVADRYLHRPLEFQQAYVDLNEGRLEEAEAAFDALVAEEPDDPVVRLERGRTRLLAGDPAGAREDFEAAWPQLGDEYLDQLRDLSVPTLWAEACLGQGDAAAVVDGLAGLAGLSGEATDEANVAMIYTRALVAADRPSEALEYLERALPACGGRQDLLHLLAEVLEKTGDPDRAIAVLEQSIAPSCTTGGCGTPALYTPSALMLARLYLDRAPDGEEPPERVGELLALILRAQGGSATPDDLRLLLRYQRASGLDEEAAETEAMLRQMEGRTQAPGGASDSAADSAVSWSSPAKPVL